MELAWNTQKNQMKDVKGKEMEQERKGKISNEDIDLERTHLNVELVESDLSLYQRVKERVNDLKESGVVYKSNKSEYARMDNTFSKSRIGIGYSSNLAQLAMTYYWSELQSDNPDPKRLDELSDNFVILSVLACY